jgi:hypothetical protein
MARTVFVQHDLLSINRSADDRDHATVGIAGKNFSALRAIPEAHEADWALRRVCGRRAKGSLCSDDAQMCGTAMKPRERWDPRGLIDQALMARQAVVDRLWIGDPHHPCTGDAWRQAHERLEMLEEARGRRPSPPPTASACLLAWPADESFLCAATGVARGADAAGSASCDRARRANRAGDRTRGVADHAGGLRVQGESVNVYAHRERVRA